jgi:hypothetical protein
MEEVIEVEGTSTEIKDPTAVLAALERAKADAKRFREEKEALELQISEFNKKNGEVSNKLLDEKISKQLADIGIENPDRLIKYINKSDIQMSENFELVGLQTQIDVLKTDLPELFDPKVFLGGKADSGTRNIVDMPLSASEVQARMILGR